MFKISPINDKTQQCEFAKACGAEFKSEQFAYSMIDNESGELMGFSQFEIDKDGGYIYDLVPRIGYVDFEAMFILGRATMNFIDLCGVHICRADETGSDPKLLHAIGFRRNDQGILFCDMTGMFDGNCSGHEKGN